MAEVASVYVSILPSAKGFKKNLTAELSGEGIDSIGANQGKRMGGRMTSALGGVLKTGMKATAIGAAATLGTAFVKGFGRLKAIDQATAQLRGLKLETEEIAGVMDSATEAVTGTAYGLDAAATAAAGALGSGVKQGQALTDYLTLVADATTQSTTDFDSMALMMNKVQGQGKLTGEVMQQMAENGLYAMPMLAKALGKPQDEIQKMVSKGEISAEQFQKILKDNIGGAAQESGKTFSGALANMGAALGRIGAKLLSGVFPKLAPMFMNLTGLLDKAGPIAERVGKMIGDGLGAAFSYIGTAITKITPIIQSFFANFSSSGQASQIAVVFEQIKATVVSLFDFFQAMVPVIVGAWKMFGPTIVGYVKGGLSAVITIVRGALQIVQGIFTIAAAILRGDWSGMWKGITQIARGAWNVIKGLFGVAKAALTGLMKAAWSGVTGAISAGISKAVTLVKGLKGKVLGALAGAATWLSDVGKDVMRGLRDGIDRGFQWVKDKLSGVGRLIPGWLKKVLGISSPSKVMADEVGWWIPAGVAMGIERNSSAITGAMNRAAAGAIFPGPSTPRFKGALSTAAAGGSTAPTGPLTADDIGRATARHLQGSRWRITKDGNLLLSTLGG